jgi:erythronate-4-phosphate dehydrogenase
MEFFKKLRKKPILINTSRGPVLDTNAVKAAIDRGEISGFTADVWENEPGLDLELMGMSDIATPHIAGYSTEGKANGTAACVQAASRFFNFGIDNWYPSPLPLPEKPFIEIDTHNKPEEQLIFEAILASYDVLNDDIIFRNDPSRFEDLRNHYPVRREFGAFTVNISNSSHELKERLNEVGFYLDSTSPGF